MKISILGGGFGIYGYLPAACSLGWEVATLSRYKETIQARPELSNFCQSIQFVESEVELLGLESALVFARTPLLQFKFIIDNHLSRTNLSHLFLEKPLTHSMTDSQSALDLLKDSQKSFSIAYLFQYTEWFEDLENTCASQGNKIIINWRIPFTNSDWKNSQIDGGGLYSFFLVHFVPVLTRLGFPITDLEIRCKDGKYTLRSEGGNYIEINAQIVSENFCFEILVNKELEPAFQAQTPFGLKPGKSTPDPRISPIKRYLISSVDGSILLDSTLDTERDVIHFLNLCSGAPAK